MLGILNSGLSLVSLPYVSNQVSYMYVVGQPGGKISADGSLKPSFTFTLDKDVRNKS